MSIHISSACKNLDYTGAKRAVLLEFADHANDDGICWPSRSRIMYNTGLSEAAVKKQLKELRESKVLVVVDQHEGGRGKIPIYKVQAEKGPQKIPFSEWCEEHEKGAKKDLKGPNFDPERGHSVAPEPSLGTVKSTDSSENAKTESLANYQMKRIYDAMKKANYTITGKSKKENEYGRLVGRVQWMLDNMSPTDDELDGLPEAYVQAYTIRGAATDAVYALNELRRQKARNELLSETKPAAWEPVNPHGEAGTKARSKARKPVWYASCYPVSEEMAQQWVDDGLSHDDILAILAKPAGDRIAS